MLLALTVGLALAQDVPELNAQHHRIPVDSRSSMWADDAGTTVGSFPIARLAAAYTASPLVFETASGDRTSILGDTVGANVIVGYNIGRLRLGIDAPIYLVGTSDVTTGTAGLGDGAADVRLALLDPEDGLGLALGTRITAPTNTTGLPLGSAGWTVDAQAILEARPSDQLVVLGNVGYRANEKTDLGSLALGDQLFFRAAAAYATSESAGFHLDLAGAVNTASLLDGASTPLEAMLGGWYRLSDNVALRGGIGTGLSAGIGAPAGRATLAISYEPQPVRDLDGDGLEDKIDQCPAQAEDMDAYLDADGCPDHDNDGDGIADDADQCRDSAEDLDGFQDDDGCPDNKTKVHLRITDPDGYLVPGAASFVTQEGNPLNERGSAEATFELHPGVYTLQAAALGWWPLNEPLGVVPSPTMDFEFQLEPVAPMGTIELTVLSPLGEPTDATWSIGRGTELPVPLGHATGKVAAGATEFLIRVEGAAPLRLPVVVEADRANVVEARVRVPRVSLTESQQLVFNEGQIEFGKNWVREESYVLLDEVADFVLDNPRLGDLQIEVHTDSRGSNSLNQKVSEARAKSVKLYLVSAGVPESRIKAVGKGEEEPLDPSNTPEAWEQNRRVEFWFE